MEKLVKVRFVIIIHDIRIAAWTTLAKIQTKHTAHALRAKGNACTDCGGRVAFKRE